MGTVMYMIEGVEPGSAFNNIPNSIYWAIVTMTTVGYGDITPVTPVGRFLSAVIMLIGYTIIAVPTGIVSATMWDNTAKLKNGAAPAAEKADTKQKRYTANTVVPVWTPKSLLNATTQATNHFSPYPPFPQKNVMTHLSKGSLTQGSITGSMLRFAWPLMLGNLLQQCYNIADTLIVGRVLGSAGTGGCRIVVCAYRICHIHFHRTMHGVQCCIFHTIRSPPATANAPKHICVDTHCRFSRNRTQRSNAIFTHPHYPPVANAA